MKMTRRHLLVLSIMAWLCSPANAGNTNALSEPQDGEIYGALFKYILKDHEGSLPRLYISEEPARKERVFSAAGDISQEEQLKGHAPAMSDSLRGKLLNALKNREHIKVDAIVSRTKLPITVVSIQEPKEVFESWSGFVARFPGAKGLIHLSHTSVDNDGQTALVYMDVWCGALCGSGYLFVLANLKDGWRVVGEKMIWVS